MLSNTATPEYYGFFRQQVIDGKIPVCEKIALQMELIDDIIDNPRYFYDPEPVEGYIDFCEGELTTTDGSDLKLLDTFKLWSEDIFGWYEFVDRSIYIQDPEYHGNSRFVKRKCLKRLRNKQYIIVPRGNAKSIYDSSIEGYGLVVDDTTTDGIVVAPTIRMTDEVLSPLKTAISRSRGPLFKFMTTGSIRNTSGKKELRPKLFPSKKGIENTVTNSIIEARPLSIDKLQGLRNKYSVLDEWLSGDMREDPIGALEQGASKIKDYLIIATSSEGTCRNGIGDSIKMELNDILNKKYFAPHISIWWYKLDDIKEIAYPELWVKACPSLGTIVDPNIYVQEVERAEKVSFARNDILAKRFGLEVEGYTYFFEYEETLLHKKRHFYKMPCSLGIDLSMGDDFCAFTFLFPLLGGTSFGIKTRCYITQRTFDNLSSAAKEKYMEFIEEGTLIVMDGTVLNMMQIYDDIVEHIDECEYDVCSVGYDPYNATEFIERWKKEMGEYAVEVVPQGAKTESVPLGEIKKLAEDRALLFDEEMMKYTMGNCVVLKDTNGNKKLYKLRNDSKIDSVSALVDAYIAYRRNISIY